MNSIQPFAPRDDRESVAPYVVTRGGGLPPGGAAPEEPLVDVALAADLARFVRNACRRHPMVLGLVFAAFLAAGIVGAVILPRKYYTETKLLADRNVVMPLLGNPGRPRTEDDSPTRMAYDLIMSRENLLKIVRETNLIQETAKNRSFLARAKRRIQVLVSGPLTAEEEIDAILWSLRTSMNVQVGEGTVTIGAVWLDPDLSYKIVNVASRNYLSERQVQELSLISGTISILEKSAVEVGRDINHLLDSLGKQRAQLAPEEARGLLLPSREARPVVNMELIMAQSKLESTLRAIADLEQTRTRRLSELQTQLAEQRITFGAEHPQIETTQQLIKSTSQEPPQLAQLRADEERLRGQVMRLGGSAANAAAAAANDNSFDAIALRNLANMRVDSIVQEKQTYGRSRLRIAMASYQALLERLDGARIELETVRATFAFKYSVLIPASMPTGPVGRLPLIMVLGGLVLGGLMAVLTVVALDLVGRKVLEAWQIERMVGLPVLGEAPLALKP